MYKVMIVDDRDIIRTEIKRLKIWGAASGFSISQEAQNGQEALGKLEHNPVDMVITDIKMPKIDGLELLRAIVERNLCSCVVLVSDFSEFEFARQGIILGAFDYIPKPIDANELSCLLTRAKSFLDNKSLEKERIKKLEESQKDTELRLSGDEITVLTSLIRRGDEKSLLGIEQMMERIFENSNKNELIRNAGLLKNSIYDVIKELKKAFPFLDLYINPAIYNGFDDVKNRSLTTLKNTYMEKIENLSTLINLLRLDLQEKGIVKQVCNYILINIDKNITLSIVADRLYMNKTYISESFKQKIGISFTEYVTLVKMERAKVLILKDNLKTYEIAEKLGYKDAEYFSKVFKKVIGLTPTTFRLNHEGN
ncbi:response regulator [Mobilitalea sibirica]|uniref:Stage 0 sporulation protein A homolog n=1 Tax=Mobilitalea sibirica TaxID=1462919 RepID=A0A8J7HDM7_9FIRM|nr:response regulator [Mobilitalea sibirica]MBH1942262.1 response regulator [Mobilitalea sibirica]